MTDFLRAWTLKTENLINFDISAVKENIFVYIVHWKEQRRALLRFNSAKLFFVSDSLFFFHKLYLVLSKTLSVSFENSYIRSSNEIFM